MYVLELYNYLIIPSFYLLNVNYNLHLANLMSKKHFEKIDEKTIIYNM